MISIFFTIFSISQVNAPQSNVAICFLAIVLTIINPLNLMGHVKGDQVPCNIKLVFGTNAKGASEVSYDLEMQIYNQQGRTVLGASVYWLNTQSEIIGNSNVICRGKQHGIKPTEVGSCKHTVQKISERLLDRLGQDTWTEIVNSEMRNFREVRACSIIGYNYGETSVKNY